MRSGIRCGVFLWLSYATASCDRCPTRAEVFQDTVFPTVQDGQYELYSTKVRGVDGYTSGGYGYISEMDTADTGGAPGVPVVPVVDALVVIEDGNLTATVETADGVVYVLTYNVVGRRLE